MSAGGILIVLLAHMGAFTCGWTVAGLVLRKR